MGSWKVCMPNEEEVLPDVSEPRLWRKNGWTARVIPNDEDVGWAVEMTRHGDPEPALVGPWTMAHDRRNPKPMDANSFRTLVKTASEVLRRAEHAARAPYHKQLIYVRASGQRLRIDLELAQDDDSPYGQLVCVDDITAEEVWSGRVPPNFRLSAETIEAFLEANL